MCPPQRQPPATRGTACGRGNRTPRAGCTTFYDGSDPVAELDSSGNIQAVNTFGAGGLVSAPPPPPPTPASSTPSTSAATSPSASTAMAASCPPTSTTLSGGAPARPPRARPAAGTRGGSGGSGGIRPTTRPGWCCVPTASTTRSRGGSSHGTPFGYDGGVDLYSYTKNNPISGLDPSGFACIVDVHGPGTGKIAPLHEYIQFNKIHCNSGPQAPGSWNSPSLGSHNSAGFWGVSRKRRNIWSVLYQE